MRIILKPMGAATLGLAFLTLTVTAIHSVLAHDNQPTVKYAASAALPEQASSPTVFAGTTIYDGILENDWVDWSWADRDLTDSSVTENGSPHSIRADADFGQAIFFSHRPMSTAPYDRIAFSLHGGTAGGQGIVLAAIKGHSENRHSRVYEAVQLPPLAPNAWTHIVVPLTRLRSAHRSDVGGFWLQRVDHGGGKRFYIDNVRLLAPGDPAPGAETSVQSMPVYDSRVP